MLRLRTYLSPGLPLALFEAVAERIELTLGLPVLLGSDPFRSAPEPGGPDPFAENEVDLAFLCTPGYFWLSTRQPSAVELVPAAFVFEDERCKEEPLYWAELVVHADARVSSFSELAGTRWVYNDPCSMSGYFSMLAALRDHGGGVSFFDSARPVDSHHRALDAIERGEADCAAIDSNTLADERRRGVSRAVRVLQSLGPFRTQPILVRSGLAPELKRRIAEALLSMHEVESWRARLAACGVRRLKPTDAAAFDAERTLVDELRRGPLGCEAGLR